MFKFIISKRDNIVQWTGITGMYLFSFSMFLSKSGGNIGIGLMLFAYILQFRVTQHSLRRDPAFFLFIGFAVYFTIRIIWAVQEFPDTAERQIDSIADWFYLWCFLFVAWWFKAGKKQISISLGLAFAGFLSGFICSQDWSQIDLLLRGSRGSFYRQVPLMALFSGTATLGLLLLGPRILGNPKKTSLFVLRLFLLLVLLGLNIEILIITQSLTTWIAVFIVFPPLLWIRIGHWIKLKNVTVWTYKSLVGLFIVMVAGTLLYRNLNTIEKRISSQMETVNHLLPFDLEKIPYNSTLGIRVHVYRYGLARFLERPFFGWGPGTEITKLLDKSQRILDHLHNTYLEIVVRFGVIGMLFMVGAMWCIVRSLWCGYKNLYLPIDYFLFIIGSLGLLIIWSFGNFRLSTEFRFYCIIIYAIAYSFTFTMSQNKPAR